MIHPINIPDDLLAANPQRPQFITFDRKSSRPKLTYTDEGRRLREGIPVSPKSPHGLWKDVFLRSFVHRIACDAQSESAEVSSTDSIIDVVDLQPKLHPTIQVTRAAVRSQRVSADTASESEDDSDFSSSARLGVAGRLPVSRQRSVKINRDVVRPILAPCCSKPELNAKGLKQFLRLDFSHVKCFRRSTQQGNQDASDQEVLLVANETGSRIWVKEETVERRNRQKENDLRFFVSSVRIQPDAVTVKLQVHQQNPTRLQIVTHVHSAQDDELGQLLKSVATSCSDDTQESECEIVIDGIDDLIKNQVEGEYLVLTLLGHFPSRAVSP